ncbi:MAG: hypothetical protein ABIR83_14245 [Nakamurella sp.]
MTTDSPHPTRFTTSEPTLDGTEEVDAAQPYQQVTADLGVDRRTVQAREEERFGGMKFGSAFFGWLAAAGVAAILMSLLAATGVALSLANNTTTDEITQQATAATGTARTVGLIGGIALLVVLFIAYYCGGYVAGRMARFNGTKQGLAVWIWGLIVAAVVAVLVLVFGSKFNVLSTLNLPRIPVDEGSITTAGIIAIAAILIVTLGAALLGGKAGMRFHRNVDKAGFGN